MVEKRVFPLRLLGIARFYKQNWTTVRTGASAYCFGPGIRVSELDSFFCCSAVKCHESKELAQACENTFRGDFQTDTVTII